MCLGLLAFVVWLAACDIPTEIPKWDQRWIFPAGETEFEVGQLLPVGSTETPDGTGFLIPVDTVRFSTSMGDLCPSCIPLWGLRVPKPDFQGDFNGTFLPEEIVSAEIVDASLDLAIFNGFNFDPIRPDSGVYGEIIIALREGGTGGSIQDQERLLGLNTAFPPFTEETVSLDFSGRIRSSSILEVSVDSPEGDSVFVDITDLLSVRAVIDTLRVSSAVVNVGNRIFQSEPVGLGTGDLDPEVIDRLQSGAMVLEVSNPWGFPADLFLTITEPTIGLLILKRVAMPGAGVTTVRVDFTLEELRAFLGVRDVAVLGTAEVDSLAGPVTVAPGQKLGIKTNLDLVLGVGLGGGGS
ncbi:hypothetical protein ACFL3S_01275 [Gemmatimonadota bacterium]